MESLKKGGGGEKEKKQKAKPTHSIINSAGNFQIDVLNLQAKWAKLGLGVRMHFGLSEAGVQALILESARDPYGPLGV